MSLQQRRQVAGILIPACILILCGFFAARLSPNEALETFFDNLHWTVAYAAGALLAWLGVRHADSKNRDARRWFAYGLTLCALGQLAWDIQTAVDWNPYPAPSDGLFLCFGPCAAYGLLCAIRRHQAQPLSKALILDAAILAVVVLTLVVAVYIPRNQRNGLGLAVVVIYPISMLAPACVAAAMAPTLKLRPTPQWLLFVLLSIVNGALWMEWIYLSQDNALESNSWLYLLFSLGAIAIGAGALIWNIESDSDPVFERRCEWLLRMLPLFAVGGAAVGVALAWSLPNVKYSVAIAIYVGSGVMLILAIVRQSLLLFERDRLLEMEKRAGELERTFQTLFQITRGGLALLDPSGRFLEANPACTPLFGYERKELLTMNIKDLNVGWETKLDGALGLIDEHGSGTIESECRRGDGARMLVEITSALIPDSGGRIFVIFRDITQRKQDEQQLRLMAQRLSLATKAAAIGIWEFDLRNRTLAWDARMLEIYRIHPKDFHGRYEDWRRHVHPDDFPKLQAIYEETVAGRSHFHAEYRIILTGGEERHVESHAIIRTDAEGKPETMTGVSWDITERKKFAEKQARLEAQLRQSQKLEAIGTLASGIAHDFNNVLSAILGNIELALLEIDQGSPALTSLQEIRKAGQRGKDLIRRIVAFGRPQDQRAKPVQLTPIVADAIKFVRATLPATVEITAQLAAETPAVLIDGTQVPHLLLNLCTNAYQAMSEQRGRIDIRLNAVELNEDDAALSADLHAGAYVCLHVSDNGNGVDPAIAERIFEPFFTTKPAGEGSGLGLSMAHSFVRAHGGAITLQSKLGAGTTFHIFLPAAAAATETETQAIAAPGENGHGESQHILYVDDEEPLVFLTKRLLERLGYRVSGFTDAAAALAAFQADGSSFDLVITDQSMPGMSGIDLAREVLCIKDDARIVLVSGYLRPREIEQAHAVGIQEIILKPDTVDKLAAAVHRLLSPKTLQID